MAEPDNPIFDRFFRGRGKIVPKWNEPTDIMLLKKQLRAEKYLEGTTVSSAPFFIAKGDSLVMHHIPLLDQSAVHRTVHAKSAENSNALAAQVVAKFNKCLRMLLRVPK